MRKGLLLAAVLCMFVALTFAQTTPADQTSDQPADPVVVPPNTKVDAMDPSTAQDTNVASPTGVSVSNTTGVSTDMTTGGNAQSGLNVHPDQPGTPAVLGMPAPPATAAAAPPPAAEPPAEQPPATSEQPPAAAQPPAGESPEHPNMEQNAPAPPSATEQPAPPPAEQAPPPSNNQANNKLPQTASPLPLLGLLGLGSLALGAFTRKRKS